MRAFVTGSTGLLGSNLVNLLLQNGYDVRALARSREKARRLLNDPRVEIIEGDMEAIDGFADALAGCDALFHAAAYFREYFAPDDDHWTKLKRINVDGTIALLHEAERRGVGKAIYVSSSTVIGASPNGGVSDETTPPDKSVEINLYAKSKVMAEAAVAEFLKAHTLPVVLILPTAMVGPQDAAPTRIGEAIIQLLKREFPVVLPDNARPTPP
jgi:dihydroflavonol-4-reductase